MPGASSSAAGWSARLEPAAPPAYLPRRPEDPRLGEVIESWSGDPAALRPGRGVLIGFPQDEGVRRNGGRPGAAEAPDAIRRCLYRLTPWDGENDLSLADQPPLDLGNVRVTADLEESQRALGEVVAAVLRAGAVPVVLGGGHETAFGVYLGYVAAGLPVGVVNVDAHLDVRPLIDGQGHSGSPFRQMLEHPAHPLPGERYVCLGAQPQNASRAHWVYARRHGCRVRWCGRVRVALKRHFRGEIVQLARAGNHVHITLDADAVRAADVPGVSAPNPAGLSGSKVIACARLAGSMPKVASLDVAEINPRFDRDGQSARWAALVAWQFLVGLAERPAG